MAKRALSKSKTTETMSAKLEGSTWTITLACGCKVERPAHRADLAHFARNPEAKREVVGRNGFPGIPHRIRNHKCGE